ncbi:MAG: RES family NAD+ phosphorylase [Pseudobacteriovorax sp.]|nr:RES family NAD+ phosphorylase [Pseudobacteriovorax sp.]
MLKDDITLPKGKAFVSKRVFRNIPTNSPTRYLFGYDLSEEEQDIVHFWADYGSGIDQQAPQKDRWYDYQDPEDLSYCFDETGAKGPSSRYTSGDYPVWYGCLDKEEASRQEIIYHLQRQASVDRVSSEDCMFYQRAMCLANVKSPKVCDVSTILSGNPEIHDDPPYLLSQKLGLIVRHHRYSGILYPSKRFPQATCIGLFEKRDIIESRVINFFSVEVYQDRITVCGETPPHQSETHQKVE